MRLSLDQVLCSNIVLFFCSLLIGYSLWVMLSQQQILQHVVSMPVVVFQQQAVVHQETINVKLEGARAQLRSLQYSPPQVTFYREEHPENQIAIAPADILLPETISLVDYWPKSVNLV